MRDFDSKRLFGIPSPGLNGYEDEEYSGDGESSRSSFSGGRFVGEPPRYDQLEFMSVPTERRGGGGASVAAMTEEEEEEDEKVEIGHSLTHHPSTEL